VDTPGDAEGVFVSGSYVYVADGHSGLQILPAQCNEALTMAIDIHPGNLVNPVDCGSGNEIVPVAILSTEAFDATTVDHSSVRFGPAEAPESHQDPYGLVRHEEDVDDDGDVDLMFHFRLAEAGIRCGDTEATLTGETFDGQPLSGADEIRTLSGGKEDKRAALIQGITPNPFNPKMTIHYALSAPGPVRLRAFDLRGRLVAILVEETQPAGSHEASWNGLDSRGRAMPSGTYIVRLETEVGVEARKVALFR
jgi:hypothetical protein